jgi:hypothetical protein
LGQQFSKLPGCRLLIGRSQRAQCELVQPFPHTWALQPAFRFPDSLSFNLVTSFILEARLEFISQISASQEPVQSLATLFGTTDSNPRRSMSQIDAGTLKETLLNVLF